MITFLERTYKDGNFFYFPDNDLHWVDDQKSLLTKVLIETIEATISLSKSADSEKTVNFSKVASYLDIPTNLLGKRIKRLVELNILKPIEFKFSASKKLRISGYMFNNTFEEVSIEEIAPIKQTIKQKSAIKRALEKKLYIDGSYAPRPNTSEISPIRQSGNFLVEQCITSTNAPTKKMAKLINIGNKQEIKAHITSTSRIMNPEDLQVLFACYSLIHKYHENSVALNEQKPINNTPIHIADIAAVRGKTTGGTTNNKIRESLETIYRTNFEFYGLGEIDINKHSISGYMRQKFTNFAQCTPLSEVDAVISGDDIIFGKDSMIYLIRLPDDVFTELLTGKYHFVFPQASLSAPGIVFSLYLRFRSRVKNTFSESLKTTWSALAKGTDYKDFKLSLRTQLLKVNKKLKKINDPYVYSSFDVKEERLTFNLWGYHGFICFKENLLSCKCHEKEMFAACKVSMSDAVNKNAPTIENHLRTIFEPQLQLESTLPKNLSKVIKTFINKYDVTYKLINNSYTLSIYHSDSELDDVITVLSREYGFDSSTVAKKVAYDLSSLHLLSIKGRTITKSEFMFIVDYFGLFDIPNHVIVKYFIRFRSTHNDLITLLDTGDATEQLIQKIESHNFTW